jgi:Gram-negative bacterial TonB protein C-terminal
MRNGRDIRQAFRARRCAASAVQAGLSLVPAFLLVAACSTTNGQADRGTQTIRFAPRSLAKNLSPSDYYPDASKRAYETGEVILHFHIGSDGMAQAPFVVDETTKDFPRLIETAQKILNGTRYESGERYRHAVTASVLFELMPDCGKLQSTSGLDYYYRLCVLPLVATIPKEGHAPHHFRLLPPDYWLPPNLLPPMPAKDKTRPKERKPRENPGQKSIPQNGGVVPSAPGRFS